MGYTYRTATMADFDGYFELYKTEGVENFGGFAGDREEVLAEWKAPGFDPESMFALAFEADNPGPVGYVELRTWYDPPVRVHCYGYVHPGHRGRGVGSELLDRAEAMARVFYPRVPDHARIVLQGFSPVDEGRALFAGAGYTATRESLLMKIDFDGPPPAPVWPDGFRLRTIADGLTLREVVEVKEEAFRDHRGSVDQPIESALKTWEHVVESNRRVYDPELFVVLCHGDTPAGELVVWTESEEDADKAYVQSLGVLPAFRRRGLGEQLLYHAFTEAYRRGKTAVGLNVDGSSLTGADRLYRRAGMHVFRTFTALEKEIRPGDEISNQG
jgi:mycothiol synthase